MTNAQQAALRRQFEEWTAGPPDSAAQIEKYVLDNVTADMPGDALIAQNEARAWLLTQIGEWTDAMSIGQDDSDTAWEQAKRAATEDLTD